MSSILLPGDKIVITDPHIQTIIRAIFPSDAYQWYAKCNSTIKRSENLQGSSAYGTSILIVTSNEYLEKCAEICYSFKKSEESQECHIEFNRGCPPFWFFQDDMCWIEIEGHLI